MKGSDLKLGVENSGVDMSSSLPGSGHLSSKLFNPTLQPQTFQTQIIERIIIEKIMLEESLVQKFMVKKSRIDKPGGGEVLVRVKRSRVKMSRNL